MANVINYAAKYQRELIETYIDGSYIAPFVTTNVEWLNAKDFHFTVLQTGGYKNHSLNGGWNRQDIKETDKTYSLDRDRDVELFIDKRQVDESNQTATAVNVSNNFETNQATPEKDAYFFSKIATTVPTALKTSTGVSTYTAENIYSKIVEFIGRLRRYRNKGLIVYAPGKLMDLLALSKELQHPIDTMSIVESGKAIQTRITKIDGVPIVEVIDDDRFYDKYNFDDGYKVATGAHKINLLGATPLTSKLVPKIESVYMWAPGTHTVGDGYLYQNRAHYGAFTFPNGKTGEIDSIAVDLDTATTE